MVYMFFSCFEQLGLRHRKFEVVCSKTKVGRGALTGLLLVKVNSYVLDRLFKNRKWGKSGAAKDGDNWISVGVQCMRKAAHAYAYTRKQNGSSRL